MSASFGPIVLFRSVEHPGVVMNRYGVVLRHGAPCNELRSDILREAQAAGWRLDYDPDRPDTGRTWQPPRPA